MISINSNLFENFEANVIDDTVSLQAKVKYFRIKLIHLADLLTIILILI